MEAIILAGGFGRRLAQAVPDLPKPMAPVCGRPFLRYILDDLQQQGVERVILAVGYKWEAIGDFFGKAYRGMELIYSVEREPLLTGGAMKQALALCKGQRVFVVNGDTYFKVDLAAMAKLKAPLVVAVKRLRDFDRYGTVLVDQGHITGFREKAPCSDGLINGGLYLLDRTLLADMPQGPFSFERDFMEHGWANVTMLAYESGAYFLDIGVPEDYAAAQESFKDLAPRGKAVFFDRDGTINVDTKYLHRPEDLRFIGGMPHFIKKWNDWAYRVIVVTNQSGIARGYYSEDQMRTLHRHMNTLLAEYGAHIDAFYFCPHHPDFTGPCGCRKPEPGLIEAAIWDFDLEPELCLLFGDNIGDIQAGEKCGVRGILVGSNLTVSTSTAVPSSS